MNTIKVIKGNLFATECQTIVNTVNCVGVMGAGVALEFKYRYPEMFQTYVQHCRSKHIDIGKLWVYKEKNRKWVLNFPTKRDWKQPSKIEYLEQGLQKLVQTYKEKGIKSIAFPLLGASNGGIDPKISQEIMEKYLSKCEDLEVEIYHYTPKAKDDLVDIFIEAIRHSSASEIQKLSGLTKNALSKLRNVTENQEIFSLIQLSKIKGIGKDTVAKAYKLAINYQKTPIQTSVFESSIKVSQEVKEIQKEIVSSNSLSKTFDKEKILLALSMMQENIQIMQQEILNIKGLLVQK